MTKKLILPLAAIILLSSCAGKFGLQKRRYTRGYYVSTSKKSSTPEKHDAVKTNHAVVKHAAPTEAPVQQHVAATQVLQPVNSVEFVKAAAAVKQAAFSKHPSNLVTASVQHHPHAAISHNAVKPLAMPVNKPQSSANDSDVALILLVILCLFPFINLIPVYLHDGKKVTLNFILTLLLDFLIIVGIIFALLVVLDVIDVA